MSRIYFKSKRLAVAVLTVYAIIPNAFAQTTQDTKGYCSPTVKTDGDGKVTIQCNVYNNIPTSLGAKTAPSTVVPLPPVAAVCNTRAFSGATKSGGATATMVVSSATTECSAPAYLDKDRTIPLSNLRVIAQGNRGSVTASSGSITYRPRGGVIGEDTFIVGGWGFLNGQRLDWKTQFRVVSAR